MDIRKFLIQKIIFKKMKTKKIFIYFFILSIIISPFFYMVYAYSIAHRLFVQSKNIVHPLPSQIYDCNGELISEIYDQYRIYTPLKEVPEKVIKAFLTAEDKSFYFHRGFDIAGVIRALFMDIVNGDFRQGGSTITQQLVKRIYTGVEKSVERKLIELFIAMEFEKKFSKEKILELYLNDIYFGHGVYGISAASNFFFAKPLTELNFAESAFLASLPSAPDRFSPFKNPSASEERSRAILLNLVDEGLLSKEQAAVEFDSMWKSFCDRIKIESPDASIREHKEDKAPWVTEYIRQELAGKIGENELLRGGFKIYTTINLKLQNFSDALIADAIARQNNIVLDFNRSRFLELESKFADRLLQRIPSNLNSRDRINFTQQLLDIYSQLELFSLISGNLKSENIANKLIYYHESFFSLAKAEGALVAINPISGEIIALTGGSQFRFSNQFNRAVQSKRQPGSAFKVFVYGAAIESGKITAASQFQDLPVFYGGGSNLWAPANYDRDFSGRVLARKALAFSLNVVAARVYDIVGGKSVAAFAAKVTGLPLERFNLNPSLSLGTSEMTPLEMVRGFSTFANGGFLVTPHIVKKIEDRDGNVIYNFKEESQRVISEALALIITDMLQDVIEYGTAHHAVRNVAGFRHPCAGKTGTNTNFRDAWFVGFTPDIAAALWVGCESPEFSLGSGQSGSVAATPLWARFMFEFYKERPFHAFASCKGVKSVNVCALSGLLPERGCPLIKEFFLPGTEPVKRCDGVHGRYSGINEIVNKAKKSNLVFPQIFKEGMKKSNDNDLPFDIID